MQQANSRRNIPEISTRWVPATIHLNCKLPCAFPNTSRPRGRVECSITFNRSHSQRRISWWQTSNGNSPKSRKRYFKYTYYYLLIEMRTRPAMACHAPCRKAISDFWIIVFEIIATLLLSLWWDMFHKQKTSRTTFKRTRGNRLLEIYKSVNRGGS